MERRKLEELEDKFIKKDLQEVDEIWGELKTSFGSIKITDLQSLNRAEDYIETLRSELVKSENQE